MNKKLSRIRRSKKTRCNIASSGKRRLTVHRTPRHIYAQIITECGSKVEVSASTVQSVVAEGLKSTGNVEAAQKVGTKIAEMAIEAGIKDVAFDRSGFKYHGRVKALADAAREAGLEF